MSISTNLGTKHPWLKGIKVGSVKKGIPFLKSWKEQNNEITLTENFSSPESYTVNFNQTWSWLKAFLGEKELKTVQIKQHSFFQGEVIKELGKGIDDLKNLLQNPSAYFNSKGGELD